MVDQDTFTFGRAIVRPSIEAVSARTTSTKSELFGRAIVRPSIEAR